VARALADAFTLSDETAKGLVTFFADTITLSDDYTFAGIGFPYTRNAADTITLHDHLNITLNGVVVFPAKTKRVINVTKIGHVPEEVDTT
jgi:hypothetical protein